MNRQFSTQAANADVLGNDNENGASEGLSDTVGADGTPRDRSDRKPGPQAKTSGSQDGNTKPGQDINAPGPVTDNDAAKPS